jgi:hypothetical protein
MVTLTRPLSILPEDTEATEQLWEPLRAAVTSALRWCHQYELNVHLTRCVLAHDIARHDPSQSCPSLHAYGLALDFGLFQAAMPSAMSTIHQLQLAGEVFESFGFTWGGRWPSCLQANHVHWDKGIGNRPRTFDRHFRDGGLSYLYSRLLQPTGDEHSEQQCKIWFNTMVQPTPGLLIQGALHVPLEQLPIKQERREGIELEGTPYIKLDSSYRVDASYWPSVTVQTS